MNHKAVFFLVYFSVIYLFSCNKAPAPHTHIEKGFEYLPLENTTPKLYKYSFINIDLLAGIRDTSVWYFKELITDTITDTLDCTLIRVERLKRRSNSDPWEPATTYSYRVYANKIVRVYENIPYLILDFPIQQNKTWNGNIFNTLDNEDYIYSFINTQDTVGQTAYDSVLVVNQQEFESLYTYQLKEERYAYGVGLILKVAYDVESQPNHAQINLSDPILERITKGTIEKYELIQ